MDLDAHLGQFGQGAVHDQPLVQKARGSLDDIRPEPAGHAHRIVGGVDRDANPVEQAFVAEPLHPVPERRPVRAEEIAGLLHQNGVGAFEPQALQRRAGLGLDEVGAAIAAGGLHHHAEGRGAGHQLADHPLGAAAKGRVQEGDAGAGGDLQDVAHLGLGRPAARTGRRVVEAELSGRQAKLGAQIASSVHEALLLFPPVFGPDHAGDCLMKP